MIILIFFKWKFWFFFEKWKFWFFWKYFEKCNFVKMKILLFFFEKRKFWFYLETLNISFFFEISTQFSKYENFKKKFTFLCKNPKLGDKWLAHEMQILTGNLIFWSSRSPNCPLEFSPNPIISFLSVIQMVCLQPEFRIIIFWIKTEI